MNIGLILAGGMGKGAYQVGALKAINKIFPRENFPYISASSIGALNGYGFSCGKIDQVEKAWRSVNAVSDNITVSELLKSDYIKRAISEVTVQNPVAKVLSFPLLTLEVRERKIHYIDIASEKDADRRSKLLCASIAVPLFGRAVYIDGVKYWDGAVVENMPITPIKAYDNDVDFYIAIYFDSTLKFFDDPSLSRKTLKICFDDGTLIKNATCLTKKSINTMIAEGEEKTSQILSFLVPDSGEIDKDRILDKIAFLSTLQNEERAKLISSSRALSALNGVTKHLMTN